MLPRLTLIGAAASCRASHTAERCRESMAMERDVETRMSARNHSRSSSSSSNNNNNNNNNNNMKKMTKKKKKKSPKMALGEG